MTTTMNLDDDVAAIPSESVSKSPRQRSQAQRRGGEGRPSGRPRIDADTEGAIRAALVKGDKGMRKIAADLGVGVGTVQRVKAELEAA